MCSHNESFVKLNYSKCTIADNNVGTDDNLFLRVSFGVIAFLSCLDNFLLCLVMLRRRRMLTKPYNKLIFSLAITDFLTGVAICVTPGYLLHFSYFNPVWPSDIGDVYCRTIGSRFFIFCLSKSSTLTVMFLAIDRWMAVVKPIKYKQTLKKKRVFIFLTIIWLCPCVLQINKLYQYTIVQGVCVSGPLVSPDAPPWSRAVLIVSYTVLTFYIPSIVTWVTFAHIWIEQRKSLSLQTVNIKTKKRLLRMCAFTAFFLTVCWLPTETLYTLYPFKVVPKNITLHRFTVVFAMINSVMNPVIYCVTNQEYKKEFVRLFCCTAPSTVVTINSQSNIPEGDNEGHTCGNDSTCVVSLTRASPMGKHGLETKF